MLHAQEQLNIGENIITISQYSPLFIYNTYGYLLTNLNNLVFSKKTLDVYVDGYQSRTYRIFYATADIASATQPTD